MLNKQVIGYQLPVRGLKLILQVGGDDIELTNFLNLRPKTIAVRRFNRYLQDYFTTDREFSNLRN